jgi:hypothetical protein
MTTTDHDPQECQECKIRGGCSAREKKILTDRLGGCRYRPGKVNRI